MFDNENLSSISGGLNPRQEEAVNCLEGPLLIMAGAGSGKTRVLTCRIANLLAHGVSPRNILAITFTNKAAKEMKSRAEKMIGESAQRVWISTFHSLCARILRREIEITGTYRKNYVIYDDGDSKVLIKECMKELNLDPERFANVVYKISEAKNNLITAAKYRENLLLNNMTFRSRQTDFENQVMKIYGLYERKLIENNALDFDDLIFVTVRIFQTFPEVLQKYQSYFRYILVDEYQDTNYAQYVLTKLLAAAEKNICVVGDADQSIYGWRGADMRNILNFEKDYPDATVIKLEQNYRSTKQILEAANAVIRHNVVRKDKNLWTDNEEGEKIRFRDCVSDRTEAAYVAREISKLVENENYRYGEIAILYRTNAQSRVFEEKFVNMQIPYFIVGGLKFYERKEIKDILAYLRLIFNPRDNISFMRIINVPKRGLGSTTISRLADFAEAHDASIFEIIADQKLLDEVPTINDKTKQKLREFASMIMSFTKVEEVMDLPQLINAVLEESGYLPSLKEGEEGRKPENVSRVENLGSFVNGAKEFLDSGNGNNLEEFLNHIALITDLDATDEEDSRVSLMTVHSAKGLEFPAVFVVGMEEGLFPHANSLYNEDGLEEERRACYVAITRAQQKLYLSSARERRTFGKPHDTEISRFIKEIPTKHLYVYQEKDFGGYSGTNSGYGNSGYGYQNSGGYNSYNSSQKKYSAPTATRPAKVTKKKEKPVQVNDWYVGEQVKHKKWGLGTVMAADKNYVTIVFANAEVGEKTLTASTTLIEKV